jgi:protein-S-isoprenylcysteine O-methyltransferase Ste14
MSNDAAHSSGWQIGEVVFGVPFLVAIGLGFVAPLSWPGGFVRQAAILLGAALIIMGVAFIVAARRELARRGQPTDPGRPTTTLVRDGVFSISRNPIYLGAGCIIGGIGLAANLPWALAFLLLSLVACNHVLIAPEERYLLAHFGDQYRAYAATVKRWIGRA